MQLWRPRDYCDSASPSSDSSRGSPCETQQQGRFKLKLSQVVQCMTQLIYQVLKKENIIEKVVEEQLKPHVGL